MVDNFKDSKKWHNTPVGDKPALAFNTRIMYILK